MPQNNQPIPQAHLDALAQSRGFPDYQTWVAWHAKQQAGQGMPAPAAAPTGNVFQNLLGSIPVHPAYLLQKVGDAYARATGQGPQQ